MKNLSIRYKLLLGFILVATLMLASSIYTLHNLIVIKNDIIKLSMAASRTQVLLEMKIVSYQISNFHTRIKGDEKQSPEAIDNIKNDLLALLEEINELQKKYRSYLTSQQESGLDFIKLKTLRDAVVLTAIENFQKQEVNRTNLRGLDRKSKLDIAINNLNYFIENAVSTESNLLMEVKQHTLRATNYIYFASFLASILVFSIAIAISLFLTKMISEPIIKLRIFSQGIDLDHLEKRISIDAPDEIGDLSNALNVMLDHLSGMRSQLIEASRMAGGSEVASSVIHNIGNVLNSINTSVSQMDIVLKKNDFSRLKKTIALIEDHMDHIGDYLKNDPQGKLIPSYLSAIDKKNNEDYATIQEEVTGLIKKLNHVNNVIHMHQSAGKKEEVYEKISLPELTDDAISIISTRIKDNNILIEKHYNSVSTIHTVKAKIQQALINLFKNAVESLGESNNDIKKLIIKIEKVDSRVYITISDNGVGIDQQNLVKIFSFGFTTKPEGHGYGLHYSAILINELGGHLSVKSDGLGAGAAFTIELPLKDNLKAGHAEALSSSDVSPTLQA